MAEQKNKAGLFCLFGLLALVVLVLDLSLSPVQGQAPGGKPEMTDEEKEALERKRLIKTSYKTAFVHSSQLDPEEALQMLKNVLLAKGDAEFRDVPLAAKLVEYANVTEEKCSEPDKVKSMREDHRIIKEQYPALEPFIVKHFREQFELCGFHIKYKEDFANFKVKREKWYKPMKGFMNRLGKFGKIQKNFKGDKLDNPYQYNEAFYDMYEENKQATRTGGKDRRDRVDAAIRSYGEMNHILQGTDYWANEVHPSVDLAKYHPDAHAMSRTDDEFGDALRHDNTFMQMRRTNYHMGMDRMFGDTYDEGNQWWDALRDWSHRNNLAK